MDLDAQRTSRLAALAIVTGAVVIGSSPILIRLSELAPTATAFYRVALAVPVLYLAKRFEAQPDAAKVAMSRTDAAAMILGGALFALDLACFHWSLAYTTIANSVLFLNLAPVFASLAAWALFGERLTAAFLASLALAIAGVALLVGSHPNADATRLLGDGLAVAAGACYGGYLLIVNRLRRRSSALSIMASTTAVCAICVLPMVLVTGESMIPQTLVGVGVLLALALLTHAAGQGLIAYALKALPAASSTMLLLQPLVAAIAAWIVFGESLGALQMLGAAIVLAGVYLCRQNSVPLSPRASGRAATGEP